jgi:hypothetical protein
MSLLCAALPAFHILVDKPLPTSGTEAVWVAVGAITTGIMALFTGWLAFETWRSLKVTRAESDQRERHHKESLSPNLECVSLSALLFGNRTAAGNYEYIARLQGNISNIGPGPVRRLYFYFEPLGMESIIGRHPYIPAGEGRSWQIDKACEATRLQALGATVAPGQSSLCPFRCLIAYDSIFGELGWIVLSSASGNSDDVETVDASSPQPKVTPAVLAERYGFHT